MEYKLYIAEFQNNYPHLVDTMITNYLPSEKEMEEIVGARREKFHEEWDGKFAISIVEVLHMKETMLWFSRACNIPTVWEDNKC
jgi:hypothetical protein